MNDEFKELISDRNSKVKVKLFEGHFARSNSHVNTYIDLTDVRCVCGLARETAKVLAEPYLAAVEVDTIICLDGMQVVGAFLAEELSAKGMVSVNRGKDLAIVTPETNQLGQMMFRDNLKERIKNKKVLILSGSINTGNTMLQAIDTVLYYGGNIVGVCSVFSAVRKVAGILIHSVFSKKDIPGYQVYAGGACPLCEQKKKVDAIVSSYGYSKI